MGNALCEEKLFYQHRIVQVKKEDERSGQQHHTCVLGRGGRLAVGLDHKHGHTEHKRAYCKMHETRNIFFVETFHYKKFLLFVEHCLQRAPSIKITTATAYKAYISMLAIAKIRMDFKKRLFSEQFLF